MPPHLHARIPSFHALLMLFSIYHHSILTRYVSHDASLGSLSSVGFKELLAVALNGGWWIRSP